MLLERGADAKAHDKQGWTPLHQASQRGHKEVARILLENGANVGAKDKLGYTPLHVTLAVGCVELSRMLLDYGADTEARNVDGRTAVECALPRVLKELQLPSNRPPANPPSGTSGAGYCCTM
jgi:ankyrin repeat protein